MISNTNPAPDKFDPRHREALEGLRRVVGWAARHGLVRTDRPNQVSARWGDEDGRTFVWCYPATSMNGLQLWLKPLPESEAARLRARLTELGAPQPKDPFVGWGTVIRDWDRMEGTLDEYLGAYLRAGHST